MSALDEKVLVIAGGGGSLGSATAALLAAEGSRVVIVDHSGPRASAVAEAIRDAGGHVIDVEADTSSEHGWARAMDAAVAAFGAVDGFANFAAMHSLAGLEATGLDAWRRTLDVNLTGAWLGMKAVIPLLRSRGGGSIVNVGSIDALVGSGNKSAYHASKGGVRMMSRSAAREYGAENIRINSVHPGPMESGMHDAATQRMSPADRAAFVAHAADVIPLGRLGRPLDVAYAVRFLLSDESSYLTGVDLAVDGGFTA